MIAELAPAVEPALPATPYVGLVPYGEGDAAFFFGRVKEQRVIAGNLRASRLTIVYGPSGVGKTSLLQAGVIHGLRERVIANAATDGERAPFAICAYAAWRDEPLATLVEAIRSSAVEASGGVDLPAWKAGEPLVDTLRAWTARVQTLLVVLDQFEDYFLYHADESGEGTFATEFPRIVNEPNLRVNFVVSIREDAWAKLDRFKGDIPRLFSNYVRVEHLRPEAAGQAIEGPIAEWNRRSPPDAPPYTVERELVRAVIEATTAGRLALAEGGHAATPETAGASGIEAPFLQLVMERVWRATVDAGSRELTLARLTGLGGPERIVETHLHEALGGLSRDEQGITADIFRYLVTRSKTKIAHSASDLAEWTKRPAPEVSAVLEKLCRGESGRILRPVEAPKQTEALRYELFHDMLAEPILEWRRSYEQRRTRRRWAGVGAGLLALVAVFAGLGAWALVQRSHARDLADRARNQALVAESERLGTVALSGTDQDPDQAALLSLEAYRMKPTFEARNAILTLLPRFERSAGALIGHTKAVQAVAFSPDGRTLASGGDDDVVRLWDVRRRRPVGAPLKGTQTIAAVAFSPDGRTLASGSSDGTVRLWDSRTHRLVGAPLKAGIAGATAVAFSPDGRMLASGVEDRTIRIWDARTRRPLRTLSGVDSQSVMGLAFSPDGRTFASAGLSGGVRLWDARTFRPLGRPLKTAVFGSAGVSGVAFSPDGHTLAAATWDNTLQLWDTRTHRRLGAPLKGHAEGVNAVAFSPDGKTVASAGADQAVRLWDVVPRHPLSRRIASGAGTEAVAFSPDGRTLASSSDGGKVRLWDARSLRPLGPPLKDPSDLVGSLAFSPDGHTLAVAGHWDLAFVVIHSKAKERARRAVQLWDVRGRRPLEPPLRGHKGIIFSVAFSPDGRTLATGGDTTVRLWDARTHRQLGPSLRPHAAVNAIAFSAHGGMLAAALSDSTLRLWDVRSRRPLGGPLRGHTDGVLDNGVLAVAFSPDGRTLASGGADDTVRLWDARTHRPLGTPLRGHSDAVTALAFSPDGRTLASSDYAGTGRLWDLATHRPLGAPLTGLQGGSLAFRPDGRTLAAPARYGLGMRLFDGILWNARWALFHDRLCSSVHHNLSTTDWHSLIPGQPYHRTCV